VTEADRPTSAERQDDDAAIPTPAGRDGVAAATGSGEADGVPAVREAEARLRALDVTGTPAASQVATYDEVHAVLQDALADLDER
jgi:hypothetical protein